MCSFDFIFLLGVLCVPGDFRDGDFHGMGTLTSSTGNKYAAANCSRGLTLSRSAPSQCCMCVCVQVSWTIQPWAHRGLR